MIPIIMPIVLSVLSVIAVIAGKIMGFALVKTLLAVIPTALAVWATFSIITKVKIVLKLIDFVKILVKKHKKQ